MASAYTDTRYGVAVTTSFQSLWDCFQLSGANPKVLNVTYHDLFDESVVFDHLPSAYKHLAFKHEQEVRAYLPSLSTPGMQVPVDLEKLIDRVTIAPNAPDWFEQSVLWVLKSAGLNVNLNRSIFSKPLY